MRNTTFDGHRSSERAATESTTATFQRARYVIRASCVPPGRRGRGPLRPGLWPSQPMRHWELAENTRGPWATSAHAAASNDHGTQDAILVATIQPDRKPFTQNTSSAKQANITFPIASNVSPTSNPACSTGNNEEDEERERGVEVGEQLGHNSGRAPRAASWTARGGGRAGGPSTCRHRTRPRFTRHSSVPAPRQAHGRGGIMLSLLYRSVARSH